MSDSVEYYQIPATDLPHGLRWDVPRRHQGQPDETAYADWPRDASEAGHGSPYMRHRSMTGQTTYYRTDGPWWGRVATAAEIAFARLIREADALGVLGYAGPEAMHFTPRPDAHRISLFLRGDRIVDDSDQTWGPGSIRSYVLAVSRR